MDKSAAVASETSRRPELKLWSAAEARHIEHDREQGPANEPCFLESTGVGRISFPHSSRFQNEGGRTHGKKTANVRYQGHLAWHRYQICEKMAHLVDVQDNVCM